MEPNVEKLCVDLKELLEDICTFFSNEKLGKLSAKDQKLAESLIIRSKKQLQEISKVQPQPNEDYVIMNNQVDLVMEPEQEQNNFYSSVEIVTTTNQSTILPDINPYKDLSAKDASNNVKSGWFFMKWRFLLGFEKMKRVYGIIHNHWLLIYLSEKDLKPSCTINLKHFVVKGNDGKKRNFQLLCTKPDDNKVYHFIALTYKDMLQWTTQMKLSYDLENDIDNLNIDRERKYLNTTENVSLSGDDSDGIYEQLTTVNKPVNRTARESPHLRFHTFPNSKPNLRSTSTKVKRPIKVPPPMIKSSDSVNNSSESLVSYHEIFTEPTIEQVSSNSTKSFEDSFSDNSEDSLYETFACAKPTVTILNEPKSDTSKKKNVPLPELPVQK